MVGPLRSSAAGNKEGTAGSLQKKNDCKCRKTMCLQLFCRCFSLGNYCRDDCKCHNCHNNIQNQNLRKEAMEYALKRHPHAPGLQAYKKQSQLQAANQAIVAANQAIGEAIKTSYFTPKMTAVPPPVSHSSKSLLASAENLCVQLVNKAQEAASGGRDEQEKVVLKTFRKFLWEHVASASNTARQSENQEPENH